MIAAIVATRPPTATMAARLKPRQLIGSARELVQPHELLGTATLAYPRYARKLTPTAVAATAGTAGTGVLPATSSRTATVSSTAPVTR